MKVLQLLKYLMTTMTAFAVFLLMRKLLGSESAGAFPQVFRVYGPSIFVKTQTLSWAIPSLMALMLAFSFCAFQWMGKTIHPNPIINGLLFGSTIALLWFFGFIEMGNIIPSEEPIRHVKSALRDGTMWIVSGMMMGWLFSNTGSSPHPKRSTLFRDSWVIPLTAVCFGLFHGIQYSLFLKEIPSHPWHPRGILVLVGTGAAVGWMYWLFRPNLLKYRWRQRVLLFTFLGFGANWLLFTHFYSLFLDWPLGELTLRCAVDLMAVLLSLAIFEHFASTEPDREISFRF